jgi:diguanylate cyclase (GGDEF)-like protein
VVAVGAHVPAAAAIEPERVSAALLEIEDALLSDVVEAGEAVARLEDAARALGDDPLLHRARLCRVAVLVRTGELAEAARLLWPVQRWAEEHHEQRLRSRVHVVWSQIHQLLGDAAQHLDHSLRAVEFLDDTATRYMRIWHRARLADALGATGSMEEARARYAQVEELCHRFGRPDVLIWVLNNYAYTELLANETDRAQQVAIRLQATAEKQGVELHSAILDTIGSIEIELGRYAEATRSMLACLARYEDGRLEGADSKAEYLLTLARAQRGLGDHVRAQAVLDESREICVARDLGHVLVRVHQEQAELHADRGDFAAAFAEHKVFFAVHTSLSTADREAQARTRQAMFETKEAREEAARFREQARHDPLTGLPNRRYVDEQLTVLLEQDDRPLSVALVDLDHFKQVNDRLSHEVGDQVLVRVARLLEDGLAAASRGAFAARLGGEEFLVVLPGTDEAAAVPLLDGLRASIGGFPWSPLTGSLPVTVSIGVSERSEAATQSSLLSAADKNLYAAKHAGRDRVVSSSRPSAQAVPTAG